jgi:hypothetical protein
VLIYGGLAYTNASRVVGDQSYLAAVRLHRASALTFSSAGASASRAAVAQAWRSPSAGCAAFAEGFAGRSSTWICDFSASRGDSLALPRLIRVTTRPRERREERVFL